jgi:hypothetical protein
MSNAAAARNASALGNALSSADGAVEQGIQGLQRVHQARLSQATRNLAVLTAQLGSGDPQVVAAQANVTAIQTTISRVALAGQQMSLPAVQVSATGWALQGRVLDAQLNPAAGFTVFLVDQDKAFQSEYGFCYTDATGYFLINYAGAPAGAAAATPALFIEVADTAANPVYLGATAIKPTLGQASYQTIALAAGAPPIGDPPAAIRAVAMPEKARKSAKSAKSKAVKGKSK